MGVGADSFEGAAVSVAVDDVGGGVGVGVDDV